MCQSYFFQRCQRRSFCGSARFACRRDDGVSGPAAAADCREAAAAGASSQVRKQSVYPAVAHASAASAAADLCAAGVLDARTPGVLDAGAAQLQRHP